MKEELANEILALLLPTLPEEIRLIKQAYANQHFEALKQHLHKLHGAVCYCNIPPLKKILTTLEVQLKEKKLDQISALLIELEEEGNRLITAFKRK